MNAGDTFDVPLHARVVETKIEKNGDEIHEVVVVCNGFEIARLEITFFASVCRSEEEKRVMIRRSVAACLAEAVNRADRAAGDCLTDGLLIEEDSDSTFN